MGELGRKWVGGDKNLCMLNEYNNYISHLTYTHRAHLHTQPTHTEHIFTIIVKMCSVCVGGRGL